MSENKPVNMGLQLFPPPPKKAKPARKSSTRRKNTLETQGGRESPAFNTTDGRQSALDGRHSAAGDRTTPQTGRASPIAVPGPAYHGSDIPRSHTSFSEAPTLVRSNSNSSHASRQQHTPPRGEEPVMRSIFPRYNPELPLEHQNYYPTQASPTHIPREILNRRPYSPSLHERTPLQSPQVLGSSPGRFPRSISEEPIMEPSTKEEMKELWKVVNGWRVSNSEGRSFCFKLSSDPEQPIYTLSSATQPFYTLRLDPTSTSAIMTLTRQDPSKSPKESSLSRLGSSSKPNTGIEVLSTPLEEPSRRLPPNDGLVALLYPKAASNMVIDLSNKPSQRQDIEAVLETAEREAGRLVWDEDSKKHYLVHPALVTPFFIEAASLPAWSRVEYTLEHPELPRNLVRLVRDGAGGGFLEVDTAAAARIDCFYIVDVAICAVLLVALADEKEMKIERFEAPPVLTPDVPGSPGSRRSIIGTLKKVKTKKERDIKTEEFELDRMDLDLESQESVKEKKERTKEEKIPGFFGLIWMLVKCGVWVIVVTAKGLGKCLIGLSRCLARKS